jgi:hypothetical protein
MMHVGLAAWIIQDGNYGDFEVGRAYRFALEFYPHKVTIASRASAAPRLSRVSGGLHEARGTFAFCSDRAWSSTSACLPSKRRSLPDKRSRAVLSAAGFTSEWIDSSTSNASRTRRECLTCSGTESYVVSFSKPAQ